MVLFQATDSSLCYLYPKAVHKYILMISYLKVLQSDDRFHLISYKFLLKLTRYGVKYLRDLKRHKCVKLYHLNYVSQSVDTACEGTDSEDNLLPTKNSYFSFYCRFKKFDRCER